MSVTSLVELRALTTLTAKAKAILNHSPSDHKLNSDLVDFAMAKFADRMEHKFSKHNQYRMISRCKPTLTNEWNDTLVQLWSRFSAIDDANQNTTKQI